MDGVKTSTVGARVTAGRASAGWAGLRGGIGNRVTSAGAAALEGVVETHPVADLVGDGLALVEGSRGATGNGAEQDGAAISDEVGRARRGSGGEVAVSQVAAGVVHEVEVEVLVATLAESTLHGHLVRVPGPAGVDGAVNTLEGEGVASSSVVVVEDSQLSIELGILCIAIVSLNAEIYLESENDQEGLWRRKQKAAPHTVR